jgi:hypothetical protein
LPAVVAEGVRSMVPSGGARATEGVRSGEKSEEESEECSEPRSDAVRPRCRSRLREEEISRTRSLLLLPLRPGVAGSRRLVGVRRTTEADLSSSSKR